MTAESGDEPMTVAELIEELQTLPPDLIVTVWDGPPLDWEAHVNYLLVSDSRVRLVAGDRAESS